ncbi:MAG TPA: RDD family protein [Thermoanaerobaculia bacterium]|nr:RDD family protein [Thermoanaerobaculia bacterium]
MNEVTITTPEHVPIRLEPAGAGSRFLATLIDFFIVSAVSSVGGFLFGVTLSRGIAMALTITLNFVLTWGWHVFFEVRKQGRTPGKRALRLRVIDARGLPVSLYQSLVRNIVRAIDFAPAFYGFAALATMVTASRRRLGDLVADTLVVRDAQALTYKGQFASDRRHNTLRTPRVLRLVRHKISLEEREFLLTLSLRADRMSPEARYDLMEEVAAFYRQELGLEADSLSGENFVRDLTAVLFNPQER